MLALVLLSPGQESCSELCAADVHTCAAELGLIKGTAKRLSWTFHKHGKRLTLQQDVQRDPARCCSGGGFEAEHMQETESTSASEHHLQ